MSFVKKLNRKWADNSILEKIIKILMWIAFFLVALWALWDDIDFYCSTPSMVIIPLLIALGAGICIYFFAIYLSPPKRRIAGFIWWGIGNICLLLSVGFWSWLLLEIIESLQSPYPEVVKIGEDVLYPVLFLLLCPILISIVSWYFLIRKYKKSKKHCIPRKNISAADDV